MNIGLVNYGLGNIYSTTKAIEKLGYNISLVSDPDKLKLYDCLILPGVGGFPAAKNNLEKTGLIDSLKNYKNSGCYIIGVCLGMQLLMSSSKEIEDTEGLNFIQGTCKKFESGKVPHVGWNKIELNIKHNKFNQLQKFENTDYYFVHSFHVDCLDNKDVLSFTEYNGLKFPSIISKENIIGCQFHPEKSSLMGIQLYKQILKNIKNG